MTLAQFLTTYGAKRQTPKPQAKAQDPKVLTLAQLQKQSRQLYFPFPKSLQAGSPNSGSNPNTLAVLRAARAAMEPLFADPTSWIDAPDRQAARALRKKPRTAVESEGFCYYAAHAVQSLLGGTLVRAAVRGPGHTWGWHTWNVLEDGWEADVTGDQFGYPPVQLARRVYHGWSQVKFRTHPFRTTSEDAHVTDARVARFDAHVREGVFTSLSRASRAERPGATG